jgi:GWxTD domain-containing protein
MRLSVIFYFLLTSSLLNLLISSELAFDYVPFWVGEDKNFIECYFSLPYSSLPFSLKGDTLFTSLSLYLYINNLLRDSISRSLSAPKGIEMANLSIIDGFGFFQKEGVYPFELVIVFDKGKKKLNLLDTFLSPDFREIPSLSPILFATYLGADSLKGRFYRNGFWFNPNPKRSFNRSKEKGLAYAYLEVYNLTENGPYEVDYRIKGNQKEWVLGQKVDTARKRNLVLPISFSVLGMKEGSYTLKVSVTDLKTKKKAEREKVFWVEEEGLAGKIIDSLLFRSQEEVFLIIASEKEKKNYEKLSPEGKPFYLKRYFKDVDYPEIKRRVDYIDKNFAGNRKGERARIILKYGIPDEIESHTFKENVRAHEHWYYRDRNYHFIFMYIRDVGEPVLLWSNVKGERNYPGWERFIDPDEYEELR